MQTEDQNLLESASPTEDEQAQTSAPDSTASDTEQTAASTEKPQEEPKPKTDWAQRRIDQLTREKYEERRQREALAAQLAQYQQPNEQTQPAQDIDRLVEQKLAEKTFNDACNRVFEEGVKADPKFESNLRTLQSVGEVNRDFLEIVTDMEDGHKILNHLGANPEIAERVLSLSPLKQALELARIEASLGKSSAAPVSKAPPPISPVGSKAAPVDPENFATTEEYVAWRKQNRKR